MDNNLKEELQKRLIDLVGGIFSSHEFELLYSSIFNELLAYPTKLAFNNFFRVINSLYDRNNFLKNSIKYDFYIKSLFSITSNSNYLTDILVRNPEYIYLILDSTNINLKISKNKLINELKLNTLKFKTFNSKINFVKLFKRKYTLIIAFNDINGIYTLQRTTLYLSYLATVITGYVFNLVLNSLLEKFEITKFYRKYTLISLGKLGGNELNYSSDIDLMLFYDKNTILKKNTYINTDMFFNTAVSTFINVMTEINEKGYIYRVDFRLRPDGKNSPLANSITSYIRYYELRGEDWEKQMLLKMNYVCGNKTLYNKFRKFIISYVFFNNFNNSPLDRIKKIKEKIEYENDNNIKLCKGGIRDIEFSIQALQLLNGPKIKKMFSGNSIYILKLLNKHKLITKTELTTLIKAYIFYRKIEHYLQLMNDTQTHTINFGSEIFNSMWQFFNFSNQNEFCEELANSKLNVRKFFDSVFITSEIENFNKKDPNNIESILFIDKNRSIKNYNYLKYGADLLNNKGFDNYTAELFNNFEPELINILSSSEFPDIILENFAKGIRSVYFPSIWYKTFGNIKYLKIFINFCLFSDRAFNIWSLDKRVSDLLLTGRVFFKDFIKTNTHRPVNQLLFILSFQFAINIIKEDELCNYFSLIITSKINDCYNKLNIKYLTVLGFGSYGTGSMNFASDIDLMFITDEKYNYEAVFNEASVFIETLKIELYPFKFDFRLRPEGGGSQIVWEKNSFNNYLKTRARIWEFLAFQKVKFICGNYNNFEAIIIEFFNIAKDKDKKEICATITEMRKNILNKNLSISTNIKYSQGALQDIDFLIQYSFFYKMDYDVIINNANFIERLELLRNIMTDEEYLIIKNNYNYLKKIELSNQNIFGVNNSNLSTDNMKLIRLVLFLNLQNIEKLRKDIHNFLNINSGLFNKYIGSNK